MGRFRNSFPDYGDPRRDALAQALLYGGSALAQGAGTQGFGALADAVPAAAYGFGQGMEQGTRRQEAELERQQEEERRRREDSRWEHTMESWRQAQTEREREQAEEEAGRAAEEERREEMLEHIREAQGDQAAKRASLLSPTNLEKAYAQATGEPEAPSAPTTKKFPDGSLRQWDPASASWKVLQHEPAGGGAERGSGLTSGQLRNEAQEVATREVGTWPQWREEYGRTREMSLPPRDESVAPGTRVGGATVLGDDPTSGKTVLDEQALRERYNKEFTARFERAMAELGGRKTPRAPAAEASSPQGGGRFEQLAGQVQQQLKERGAAPAATEKVQAVIEAVQSAVPPEVRDSPEFLQMLQQEIASGKDPSQIAHEIREAFGGR